MLDLFEFHSTPKTGFVLLGLGCGVGVGAGAPVRLSGVPVVGDVVSGLTVGLRSIDVSLGRPSERLGALLAKVSSSSSSSRRASSSSSSSSSSVRLAAGAGCGLGLGYGVGVGLFVKKSAREALSAKVAAALKGVQGLKRAGLLLSSPKTSAAAAAAAAETVPSSSPSSLERRVEELESLVCELRPEHGLCAARRRRTKEQEEVDDDDERKN